MNKNEERKEKILAFITEFGTGLAAQEEVREAVLSSGTPLWQRLIIPDMVLCFEEALRKNLETAGVQLNGQPQGGAASGKDEDHAQVAQRQEAQP